MPLMLVMFRALALAEDTQEAMVMLETEAEEDSSTGLVVGSVLGAITMVLFSLLGDFKNSFGQKGWISAVIYLQLVNIIFFPSIALRVSSIVLNVIAVVKVS